MTVWANVVHGLGYGWTGIVISGWPPVALIAAVEVLARMIRPLPAPAPPALHLAPFANGHAVPEGGKEAAERFAAELAAGNVPSLRRVQREMHLGQPRARGVRSYLTVPPGPGETRGASRSAPLATAGGALLR